MPALKKLLALQRDGRLITHYEKNNSHPLTRHFCFQRIRGSSRQQMQAGLRAAGQVVLTERDQVQANRTELQERL